MKVIITKPGAFRAGKSGPEELTVGDTITVKGDEMPAFLVGKARRADGETAVKRTAKASNPAMDDGDTDGAKDPGLVGGGDGGDD
jgi:hypothetical protein